MALSNIQKPSHTIPGNLMKPVWSKQHGAYVTLITTWLIGTLLSESLSMIHLAVLVLLLVGFNAVEILSETIKRRTPQSQRKHFWMAIYGTGTTAMTYVLWINSPLFQTMLPVFVLGGSLFTVLSVKRVQKTIPAELLTFMLFGAAGLLAYNPLMTPDYNLIITLWIMLSAYFCLSVFHVKYRIGEISAKPLIAYLITAVTIVLIAANFSLTALLVSILLIFKSLPIFISPGAYRSLQISHIGYLEIVMQAILVFIVLLTLS